MSELFIRSDLISNAGAVTAVSKRNEEKPANFSMRRNGKSGGPEDQNRREFFSLLGFDVNSVARAEQVHGKYIVSVDSPVTSPKTDALVTARKDILLTISVADCVPVLLFDSKRRIACAIHAGWRGTASNISGEVVRYIVENYASNTQDIVAFIGPSAGVCCYEVGEDVARNFSEAFLKAGSEDGKYMLDLKSANAEQLIRRGVSVENIEISDRCSICDPGFHSYRRDGESSGRMIAAIGFR